MAWDSGIIAVVATNVRRLRKTLKLSQEKFGFEADLDRTYVSQVEGQKRNISVSVLAQLARALKVKPSDLVNDPPGGVTPPVTRRRKKKKPTRRRRR